MTDPVTIGRFSYQDGTVSGPAEYMRDRGRDRLRRIEAGEDVVFNAGCGISPSPLLAIDAPLSPSPVVALLVFPPDGLRRLEGIPTDRRTTMTTAAPSRVRATIDRVRACQDARAAGYPVYLTTDPAWLVEQAINRRAGWVEDPHTRGSSPPIDGSRLYRKARGDWQRHLRLLAHAINTPRLIVRVPELGEHRWLLDRIPQRFTTEGEM